MIYTAIYLKRSANNYQMMALLFELQLPLKDPVQIFSVILFIILLAPMLLHKLKIPSILGLILAGTLIGPHGLHLLETTDTTLFGTVGLLYIMFLAGLEIDLNDFKKNRHKSMIFGANTFLIPLVLGTIASYFILQYPPRSAFLLASMFSTHTLIAYPLASRLGITKNEAVTVTVGGTIITDTLALLILAVITGSVKGELNYQFLIRLIVAMSFFGLVVLWVFPKISRWFFRNVEKEDVAQYIFVLAVVFAAGFLAELAGLEPIIGAFLAGLALNRLIPHTSPLMNRIEFIGNALFIPFFLIGVGMLVDLSVLFQGPEALIVAVTLTIVALASKWIAAFFTQKILRFSDIQRNVIFGLSSAHAAATIAIILIAYNLELLDDNVLNGTILLILITCLVSSFVTDRAGRKLAIQESHQTPEFAEYKEKILVPVANPANLEQLIDLAIMIRQLKSEDPIYPLSVVLDDQEAQDKVQINRKMFEKAVKYASASNHTLQPISRVDLNASSGIIRTIKELMITKVVMGWNGKVTAKERFFGSILNNVVENTEQMVLVTKLLHPINTFNQMILVVPPNAHVESGFNNWIETVSILCQQTVGRMHIFSNQDTLLKIDQVIKKSRFTIEIVSIEFNDWDDFLILSREVKDQDLLIVVSARQNTPSYHSYLEKIPTYLSKHFRHNSFIVLYPEQKILI